MEPLCYLFFKIMFIRWPKPQKHDVGLKSLSNEAILFLGYMTKTFYILHKLTFLWREAYLGSSYLKTKSFAKIEFDDHTALLWPIHGCYGHQWILWRWTVFLTFGRYLFRFTWIPENNGSYSAMHGDIKILRLL